MTMQGYRWVEILLSAVTAFVIGCFGSVVVVTASGNQLNKTAWILSAGLGLLAAAKDVRAQLKLPPVEATPTPPGGRGGTP
jgi:hypothetical protein